MLRRAGRRAAIGLFDENGPDERLETLALLAVLKGVGLPLIAAGGIMSRADVQAVLYGRARWRAERGTAFLVADEAGTSAAHRAALASGATRMTRAISGRPARGVQNIISSRDDSAAPDYPLPYSALKALHAAASKAGENGYGPFWAGTGCAEARPGRRQRSGSADALRRDRRRGPTSPPRLTARRWPA